MKNTFKKIIAKVMIVVCIITLLPMNASAAFGTYYKPEAAVNNAKKHIANETSCSLVCDQFTKECLKAGGIDVRAGGVEPLMNALVDLGVGTKVNLVVSDDGANFKKNDNPRASTGDLLVYYCEECSKYMHVVVVAGWDEAGNMLAYGHNPTWNLQGALVRNYNHRLENGAQHRDCYKYTLIDMSTKPFEHVHNFAPDKIEKNHPHKMYDECSCGAKYYLGWNAKNYSNCAICNGSTTGKPEVVASISSDKGITLDWSAVAGAESYTVKRSKAGGSYFQLASGITGTTFLNKSTAVDKGVQYTYIVTAVTSTGNIDSAPVSIMVPLEENIVIAAPVATGSASGTNITIKWDKVRNAAEYDVYRSDDGGNTYELKKTVNTLSYTNVGVAEGKTYYYKVKAVAGNGAESAYSNAVKIVMPAKKQKLEKPALSVALNTSGKPVISWSAVTGAEKYELSRATSENGTYKVLTTTTKLSATNSAAPGTYYYKVKAIPADTDKYTESDYSTVVKAVVPAEEVKMSAPTATVALNASGKPVISWNTVSGAEKYEVYRSVNGGEYARLILTAKNTVTHTGVTAGNTYSYKVRAVDANGKYSDYSSVLTVTIKAEEKLAAPTATVALNASGKPVISWGAVSGAAKYEVSRATGTNGTYKVLTTTTKLTVTNSVADGTYSYRVRAVDANGKYSDYSNVVTVTVGAANKLTAPTITVKLNASGKPVISWGAVNGATKYEVSRATGANGTYKVLTTTTKLTVTNSAADGTYSYRVRAVDASGKYSDYSNVVTVTVGAANKLTAPTITVKLNASGKPVISWGAVSGAAKYEVSRATGTNGTYKVLTTTTKLTVTNSVADGTYSYRVRAVDANGKYSDYSNVVTVTVGAANKLTAPTVTVKLNASGKPVISWGTVSGAAKYEVSRATSENGTYKVLTTTTKLTVTNSAAAGTYYYRVCAVDTAGNNGEYRTVGPVTVS